MVEPLCTLPPKYNGAPGQERWVIRQPPKSGEWMLDRLWWGLTVCTAATPTPARHRASPAR